MQREKEQDTERVGARERVRNIQLLLFSLVLCDGGVRSLVVGWW